MHADDVANYYDANTRRFLRFGQGGDVGAIHRAVWGPGVQTRAQAFRYVDDRLLSLIPDDAKRVLDLGCGVGASLEHIAKQRAVEGVGVTLSRVQAELANARFEQAGLAQRVVCRQADFTALPDDLGTFDFAYGIESYVQSPSAQAFFSEAARVTNPGATLAICDDFISGRAHAGELSFREARWLREFRAGWGAPSLVSVGQASALARRHGFSLVLDDDLTDHLELRRPRDHLITLMVRAGRRVPTQSPWWRNLLGGNALQMLLVRRVSTYRLLVFRRH